MPRHLYHILSPRCGDKIRKGQNLFMEKLASGVYRLTVGTPERHTPVTLLRPDIRYESLNALPDCPAPFTESDIRQAVTRRALTLELPLEPGEDIYGLGLQLKSFRQTAKKKLLRPNSDPASDTGDSHAPVPFYVSTKGYGILVDTARYAAFHCGNCKQVDGPQDKAGFMSGGTAVGHWEIKDGSGNMLIDIPAAEGVDLYIFAGENLRDAVCRYNLFSGGGALPPLWGLGVLYRADWHADQQALLALARQIREDGVPCDIFGLEPGWQTHAYSSTYVWDRSRFPDPEAFLQELKKMGFKPNLWEQPYAHPDSPIYQDLKPHAGDYFVWDGLVPDFSIKEAADVFAGWHDALTEQGVDGFKLDECDNSDFTSNWGFPDFTAFPSGMDGMQMHSVFGLLYQRTMLAPYQKRNRRTFGQVRNAGALAAPYPYVLYSDLYDHTDFVRGMASAAMSGLLWSPEVRQTTTEEELLRRVQAVIMSPQAVINCFMIPSPPWKQYDYERNCAGELLPDQERLTTLCRELFQLRMRLIPHLYTAFYRYYLQGLPPVRPLVMDWPEDPNTRDLYDTYMIGSGLLAAPVIHGAERTRVYLPAGGWYDFYTGKRLEGGGFIPAECPLDRLPLYVREGTLLALADPLPFVAEDTVFQLELQAYGQGPVSCTLYEDDGVSEEYRRGAYRAASVMVDEQGYAAGTKGLTRYAVRSVRRFI